MHIKLCQCQGHFGNGQKVLLITSFERKTIISHRYFIFISCVIMSHVKRLYIDKNKQSLFIKGKGQGHTMYYTIFVSDLGNYQSIGYDIFENGKYIYIANNMAPSWMTFHERSRSFW